MANTQTLLYPLLPSAVHPGDQHIPGGLCLLIASGAWPRAVHSAKPHLVTTAPVRPLPAALRVKAKEFHTDVWLL